MSNLVQAARKALEALEYHVEQTRPIHKTSEAITTLRQALEQAADEPVLQDIEQYRLQIAGISVAALGYWKEGDSIHPDYDIPALHDVAKLYAKYDALYKAKAAREWVGLTDDEIESLYFDNFSKKQLRWFAFARAIETKLKESNK
jgi:hypothetical protein